MQGKCREFLGNRALLAEDGPRFSSPTAGLAKNSLRPGTGNLLARTGNLFRGAGNSWEAMPASKARRLGQPIRLRARARDEHSAHLGGSGCVASRRFRFGFHSAEFWHTTRSSDRIEPTKRSSTNSSPIETTWISRRSWLRGKASTTTTGPTTRTVERHHTKCCGRSYASGERPA